jgi:SAM-dependent methyltransferase
MTEYTHQPIQFDRIADLYDSYVRTEFDVPFWLKEAQSVGGKVLELTCGTGRVSIPLLKAGVDLTCVDYSTGMLSVLRRKLEEHALQCPIYYQDMADLSLPDRFELIFIPFHSLSEVVERDRQRRVLQRIHTHLSEGGRFICTLQNPAVRTASMDGNWNLAGEYRTEEGDALVIRSRLTYDKVSHVASGHEVFEKFARDGSAVDRRSLNVVFYLFEKTEFELLAAENGFEVVALYGDYEYHPFREETSAFTIWKLRKR